MDEPVALSPRLSPHKFLAYVAALVFGILCGPLPYHSVSIQMAFANYSIWEDVWSYLLLLSGLFCIVGSLVKDPLVGLPIETGGLIGSFFGWLVYALAITSVNINPSIVLIIYLCAASLWQAFKAQKELHNVSIAGSLPVKSITVPVLPAEHGSSAERLSKGDK